MDNTEFRKLAQPDSNYIPHVLDIGVSQQANDVVVSLTDIEKKQVFKVEDIVDDFKIGGRSPTAFVDVMAESTYGLIEKKRKFISRNLVNPDQAINANTLKIKSNYF